MSVCLIICREMSNVSCMEIELSKQDKANVPRTIYSYSIMKYNVRQNHANIPQSGYHYKRQTQTRCTENFANVFSNLVLEEVDILLNRRMSNLSSLLLDIKEKIIASRPSKSYLENSVIYLAILVFHQDNYTACIDSVWLYTICSGPDCGTQPQPCMHI